MTTWLVAILFVFVGGFALTALAAAVAVASGIPAERAVQFLSDPVNSPLVTSPPWIMATVIANEGSVCAALYLALRRLRLRLADAVPFRRPELAESAGAIALVFGLAPFAETFAEFVNRQTGYDAISDTLVRTLAQHSSAFGFVLAVLVVAVVPALVEEALFRGLLMRCFARLGRVLNVLATSVLFGLMHLDPSQAAGTFVLGLGFGFVRLRTGSVAPCMLSHAVYNAAVVSVARWSSPADAGGFSATRLGLGLAVAALGLWWLSRRRAPGGEL